PADHLCEWSRCARMVTDVEIRFVEREWFDQRSEPIQDSTDDGGFAAIDIEPCRQHDEFWTALQRHKSGHGRAHTELARLVIACCQNPASISCAAHANWLAAQRGTVADLNRGVEAVHIQMDNCARPWIFFHRTNVASIAALSSLAEE